jgi:GT2 family glycosyltransferase
MAVIVTCPTYRKFDLCIEMIESANRGTVTPDAFLILDNSAGKFLEYCTEHNIAFGENVVVLKADYNMGVARGWNFLLETAAATVPDALCIMVNDDIQFEDTTIEKLVMAAQLDYIRDAQYGLCYCAGGIDAPNAFSLFLVHPDTFFSTIGRFDETLWPAYFDDNDMHYRMKLAGKELTRVEDCTANHGEGSATIKTYSDEEMQKHHHQFRRNQFYYVAKWGGEPGAETFTQAFNGNDLMFIMNQVKAIFGF